MTEEFLKSAFAGESMAHMKYAIFSELADKKGYPNIARLFKAISYAERVHATNHARELGYLGDMGETLQQAIEGETFEVKEMYPAYKAVAELQKEAGAVRSTSYALEAEKIHAAMYERAKQAVELGKDLPLGPVHICPICGYTVENGVPDKCPVCGASRSQFKEFK